MSRERELLREFLDLCAIGDVDETTEAHGWGDLITRTNALLAQPEAEPARKEPAPQQTTDIKELENNYDWEEAFNCANRDARSGVLDVDTSPALIENVDQILKSIEGENDADSWLMAGHLNDGRYFFLSAWCDYTGWG